MVLLNILILLSRPEMRKNAVQINLVQFDSIRFDYYFYPKNIRKPVCPCWARVIDRTVLRILQYHLKRDD